MAISPLIINSNRNRLEPLHHTLSNGLRLVHLPTTSPVAYAGFVVDAGTRDEQADEYGLAHFVEHMIFKGTTKRKAWQIINRMETIGADTNAYTTKEETFFYCVFLKEHYNRAFEWLSDLVCNPIFPTHEINREVDVILDEINSYEDMPSELIFDDFEDLLYKGHALGHDILGTKESLSHFGTQECLSFTKRLYTFDNMVYFTMGNMDFDKIIAQAEKLLPSTSIGVREGKRIAPEPILPITVTKEKEIHQTHILMGGRSISLFDKRRAALFLLNNLLGGPGLNSRLNEALREKLGLVYNVESNLSSYTDTGIASVYFACDPKNSARAKRLVKRELLKVCEQPLKERQLQALKKQTIGQIGVANDNQENVFLGLGKSFLRYNRYDSLEKVRKRLESVTSEQLIEVANVFYSPEQLFTLVYS